MLARDTNLNPRPTVDPSQADGLAQAVDIGDIQNSKSPGFVPYANFPHARSNARHRLPVVWLQPQLDLMQFNAGFFAGGLWKIPDLLQVIAKQAQGVR
jgi:hypothetical protein